MVVYRFAVLTSSDRCNAGISHDGSGLLLKHLIETSSQGDLIYSVSKYQVVPDDRTTIENVLVEWSGKVQCIITTGGTGFTSRDVMPEATKSVIDKEAPGVVHALLAGSLSITPMAMLSRLKAGIRNDTLIINFPGSEKACRECFEIVKPILKHALDQLTKQEDEVAKEHLIIQKLVKSNVKVVPVADRNRHSTYEMVSIDSAMKIIIEQINSYFALSIPTRTITINVKELQRFCGYFLAKEVYAKVPLPPFNASIKDGYAVIASDGTGPRNVLQKVSFAGSSKMPPLTTGNCVRICTGAAIPDGADAVVQIEDTELIEKTSEGEETVIMIKITPKIGQDIRPIGSDIAVNSEHPLLQKYSQLGPIELGMLTSTGIESVEVFQKLNIAVMSTGDEIVSAGNARPANCIWDSNRTVLLSMLQAANFSATDMGIVPDQVDHIFNRIKRAFDTCDILITTGGVSMGEKDLIKQVLKEDFDAQIHFGRVNLKPGKPTTFATCEYKGQLKFIFALPGNPVSAFVTFHIFVKPTLELISGSYFTLDQNIINQEDWWCYVLHRTIKCRLSLTSPYRLDTRPELARAIVTFAKVNNSLESDPNKYLPTVRLTENNQISSRLLNVHMANALVLFQSSNENEKSFMQDGDLVNAILI